MFISMAFLLIIISSCKDSEIAQWSGRFVGVMTVGQIKTPIVTQLVEFNPDHKTSTISFKVYPISGKSPGDQYSLTILNRSMLELKTSKLYEGMALLHVTDHCATGTADKQMIKSCWEASRLTLFIEDQSDPLKSLSLDLKIDEGLPALFSNKIVSLDELMGLAKFNNYKVLAESEKVFQAQKNIGVARGHLLPQLSLKALLGIATGDYVSAVGSVLPFLLPGNWYKWETSGDLYRAERMSFASLRGNEMNLVEGLYYIITRDQFVLGQLTKHIDWMKRLEETLRQAEIAGTMAQGHADNLGQTILVLEKDRLSFETLIKNELSELAHALGLSPINGIESIAPLPDFDMSAIKPLDPREFFKEAQEKSYELKSIDFLMKAAKTSQKEISFYFFDLEGNGGIGFGTRSSILISKSEQKEIAIKAQQTKSFIELQSTVVANDYNQALSNFNLALSGKKLAEKRLNFLINRLLLGSGSLDDEDFINQLSDIQFKIISYEADLATSTQLWLMAKSKLNRLLLEGHYSDLEALLPGPTAKEKHFLNYKRPY